MSRSGWIFFVIIVLALLLVVGGSVIMPQLRTLNESQSATATVQFARDNLVTIRINYGTEKERWFRDAVERFQAANPTIIIDPVGEGSMESYQALSQLSDTSTVMPNKSAIPTLWSPASGIQVNLLNGASKTAMNRDLAVNCKPLVLSPLVIMIWEDRAKVFEAYYKDKGGITISNLYDA